MAIVVRIVQLIFFVAPFLSILPANSATAQTQSATATIDSVASPGNDSGSLYYLGTFSSAKDLVPHSGICGAFGLVGRPPVQLPEVSRKASLSHCDTVVNFVAGSPVLGPEDVLSLPYKITQDSKDRIIVADTAIYPSIHIFDFVSRKHSRITGGPGTRLQSPSGLAIDGHDQLYVADAKLGAILVYANGKFRRYIGKRKGEQPFERPAGIAVDPASGHIYVADPPRNVVVMLDANGKILAKFGTSAGGRGPGEFAAPTDVVVRNQELFVLDSRNYRIQVLDLAGNFRASIHPEPMELSTGFSIDNEGRIYLGGPDDTVRVFQRDGRLLFQFGKTGASHGEFKGPTGIWIDRLDRIYVADTGNHRVQTFEWGIKHGTKLPRP